MTNSAVKITHNSFFSKAELVLDVGQIFCVLGGFSIHIELASLELYSCHGYFKDFSGPVHYEKEAYDLKLDDVCLSQPLFRLDTGISFCTKGYLENNRI